ncbi:unnamed protein product [Caenorhabditis angaria]|uniref:Autophagy-related protein 16 domain-containing protein n=1 Tax=Caenorhabditis angaria TaxID=860376 RepID=A0A9P1MW69_9PELO|nr:unnamed protein product [Caenorhabditis angaria]
MEPSSSYRLDILNQLDAREQQQKPIQTMFRHYATMAEQVKRNKKMQSVSGADQIAALKEEVATVYRMKNKNDQDLINSNRKFADLESKYAQMQSQKEQADKLAEKLAENIERLENDMVQLKDDNNVVTVERVALANACQELSEKKTQLEMERVQLIDKIRELQEKRAEFMNAEIALQEERAQKLLMEQIAKAAQDISYDERASSAFGNSPETSDEFMMTDVIPNTQKFRISAHDGDVNDIEWFTEDTFATAGNDNKVRIWSLTPNKSGATKIASLIGSNGSVTRLDYEPERRVCLAASNDKTCRLWNVDSQRLLATFSGHTDKVSSARLHQTHNVVSGSSDRTIKLWDVASLRCLKTCMVGSIVYDIIAKCGGCHSSFASGHFDKKLRFWDSRQNDPTKILELDQKITSLDIAIDGSHLLASCRDDTLHVIDIRTYFTVHTYSAENYRTACDNNRAIFSSTGDYIASGAANGSIFIWNTKTTRLEKVLRAPRAPDGNSILSLSWNQSGRGLLACDKQKTCSLWR